MGHLSTLEISQIFFANNQLTSNQFTSNSQSSSSSTCMQGKHDVNSWGIKV